MDLQGWAEAANNKKEVIEEEKNVNGNEIYASLVFIQNCIQALKMQLNEQNKIYTENTQKLNLKINNGFTDLQKSISAVPVQTQTLTVTEVKEIIKAVQTIEKSTLNVCNELREARENLKQNINFLEWSLLLLPVTLVLLLVCYHYLYY